MSALIDKKWIGFFAVVALFALGHTSEAARSSRVAVKTSTSDLKRFELQTGVGLSMLNSTGFALVVGAAYQVDSSLPLFVGLDTGLNLNSGGIVNNGFGTSSSTAVTLPLLPTAYYKLSSQTALKPYIGVSLGPIIGLSNAPTEFAFLFRPGAEVAISETLSAAFEGKFGSVAGSFFMVPHGAIKIAL